jgi:bleomycin hydrolase
MRKIFFIIVFISVSKLFAQNNYKPTFIESKAGYYQNTIMKGISEQNNKSEKPNTQKYMKVDLTGVDFPNKVEEYTTYWKNLPISQGNTGTCWSFSTTSYFESEIYRQTKQMVKLSELFTVYWEYVEKAKGFVKSRGTSNFDEGSEANAVTRIMRTYGAMPMDVYDGLMDGRKIHNHAPMMEEMKSYLKSVKETNAWNEDAVIATIKSIMKHYIGEPPANFNYNGKNFTPKQFLTDYCKLNPDEYFDVTSLMEKPYYTKMEYKVPDNWWHDSSYYNVPLDVFMEVIKKSIKSGYSLTIGGDVSEPGMNVNNACVIPDWDIPSANINEAARQFRFYNHTTTDDHGMHLVGFAERNGKTWFLVKDSGAGSRNIGTDNKNFGYYFMSDDYVKLKIMDFMVHKDMLKDVLNKF